MTKVRSIWQGRRVLVTGHTGFKGAWLCLWLREIGAEVFGYSLPPPTNPSLYELADVGAGITETLDDVRDFERLSSVFQSWRPEIVIHMAAQSLVREAYKDPLATLQTNVMGTANLLQAVRLCDETRVVLVVTSDKSYENREWIWGYRETDPMGGFDPYSSSKGCAELVTAAFRRSFFSGDGSNGSAVAIASVRGGNVVGGGDWATDRLIPDIVQSVFRNETVRIRHPNAVRPWQHVLDALNGYLTLTQRLYEDGLAYAESWNFGPSDDDARTVGWVVRRMAELWGDGMRWEEDPDAADQPHEAHYLKLDCSKARSRLGWAPCLTLDQALEKTVDWYKHIQQDPANASAATLKQIREYSETPPK